ncbi:hypothetical protein [Synechococcus sp. 8F6]|uniref:hypothetical protein n=1 Tax=Synechococcus sp. 8F6 TaxID=2025606 RepID=UPI000B987E61|nr:hypothetical protein [Synechococcus sp. 8F6]
MDFATAASAPDPKAPLAKQRQWLELQRLAFANDQAEMRFESEALADEIGLTVNLTCFEPREKHQAFAHKASLLLAGDMAVSAAAYVPLVASTEDYSESTLGIPYQGGTRYRIEGRDWFDRAGHQAIYLPGQAYEVETDHFNGLLFNLNPQRLVQTIGWESKGRIPLELAERWVERPVPINLCDPRVIQQQRIIESGLDTLASNSDTGLGHPYSSLALGLETLVYQCSARMLLISLN